MIENEYISIDIRTAARRFAGVTVQDKVNGRSYDLGKDIFTIQLQEAKTDEACSKKEYTDVVEVVRCKDCKYFLRDTPFCQQENEGYCEWDNIIKHRAHYCSYGERKESYDR